MDNQLINQEPKAMTASERFTAKVMKEFGGSVGEIALTDFQKRLVQSYFVGIDAALRLAEEKRKKKIRGADPLPVTWENVNMELLARSVIPYARLGLDPAQKNHINMMPFKNNTLTKYDIVFIEGYRGIELKSKKYGLDVPDHVIVELVYTTDKFKTIKKSLTNKYESYEFEIVDDFDRGEVKGGFYYYIYNDAPDKNKVVVMTLKEILKRKPTYASPEFWGGEKDKYENGQKVGKEHVDGWYEQMCLKTVYRAAYGGITIDSQKIDDDYNRLKELESMTAEAKVEAEIEANANSEFIDVSDFEECKETQGENEEVIPEEKPAGEGPDF